mmetsp:Transcript_173370/g.556103  ORF Transcript_173370/g.556103 Transcript_173370/m.556103 type:complete len:570 (-) Transcript_173370:223-1932(-)
MRCLLEVLHDDALVRICRFLPAKALLDTGCSCRELQERSQQSVDLWRGLCHFLLGETSLLLHDRCWSTVAADCGTPDFYRRLFKAAWSCEQFCYDHSVRESLLQSLRDNPRCSQDYSDAKQETVCMSGHSAEAIGPLVVQIGGMRNVMGPDDLVKVSVLNLDERRIFEPALSEDSARPLQRMRHSTCVVRAPFLPQSAFREAILVLGGHDGNMRSPSAGTPRPAVKTLLMMQFLEVDGSKARWHEVPATGEAPEFIYNHACASFADGARVCIFGGDIPQEDVEYFRIRDRTACAFVYILDVQARHWEVVRTSGPCPSWRSFHGAVAHTSLLDGRDYFVTFGGTAEHCEPLSGGALADMRGYELDLGSFQWRQGPTDGELPGARLRFGVARWGRHLLIHGGHGETTSGTGSSYIARLNLTSLRWGSPNFSNAAPPLPSLSFETGAPQAGCVIGGAQQTFHGPRILSRLVVFRLCDPGTPGDGAAEVDAGQNAGAAESEDEGEAGAGTVVRIRIAGRDGTPQTLQLPTPVFMALQQAATDHQDSVPTGSGAAPTAAADDPTDCCRRRRHHR